VKAKLLPNSEYANAHPIADPDAWTKSAKTLPRLWQEQVMINLQQ
jgi:putative spermidine/putrescine transport system substrate-binding protein